MICLKNRTFAVSQTTCHDVQPPEFSCDLLEKSYFCSIANNPSRRNPLWHWVVICLKNRTFAVSQTTTDYTLFKKLELWFAWKIVLLQYRKQHCVIELSVPPVVICLKNRTFAVSQTTFKNILLIPVSCDLLEKSYFCSIANNPREEDNPSYSVVICLKNRTFAVSQTTILLSKKHNHALWFAWKIVLLQYRKQLKRGRQLKTNGCDLLEKSYFCSIANNSSRKLSYCMAVVICLKNRTFAVSQTTDAWPL